MNTISEKQIQEWLQKWQKRLGLSDWTISICFRDAQDMDNYPAKAKIRENIQYVDMRIMNCNDRQASDPSDLDIELDIVHELIHVRLWAIDPKEADGVLYTCKEQAIEWIAKALISSDRQEK